jgi:hypothetical protein
MLLVLVTYPSPPALAAGHHRVCLVGLQHTASSSHPLGYARLRSLVFVAHDSLWGDLRTPVTLGNTAVWWVGAAPSCAVAPDGPLHEIRRGSPVPGASGGSMRSNPGAVARSRALRLTRAARHGSLPCVCAGRGAAPGRAETTGGGRERPAPAGRRRGRGATRAERPPRRRGRAAHAGALRRQHPTRGSGARRRARGARSRRAALLTPRKSAHGAAACRRRRRSSVARAARAQHGLRRDGRCYKGFGECAVC